MPKNLELKVGIRDLAGVMRTIRTMGARRSGVLRQVDTYYRTPVGRMKLREEGRRGELIFYQRPNRSRSRYSRFVVLPVSRVNELKRACDGMFRRKGVVRKTRRLFLYENCRIHVDDVSGLGSFLEFEVKVDRGEGQARRLMNELRDLFGQFTGRAIAGSYSDMIRGEEKSWRVAITERDEPHRIVDDSRYRLQRGR